MDHDLFLTNDFAGEVYLSLNNIPGITGEEVSGFSALNPLSLPLTHPKKGNPSEYCTNDIHTWMLVLKYNVISSQFPA
jgi:hypothetical protein